MLLICRVGDCAVLNLILLVNFFGLLRARKGRRTRLELDASLALGLGLVDFLWVLLVGEVLLGAIGSVVVLVRLFVFGAFCVLLPVVRPELQLLGFLFVHPLLLLLLPFQVRIVHGSSFVTVLDKRCLVLEEENHRVAIGGLQGPLATVGLADLLVAGKSSGAVVNGEHALDPDFGLIEFHIAKLQLHVNSFCAELAKQRPQLVAHRVFVVSAD